MSVKLISKRLDRESRKFIFTFQQPDEVCFDRYAEEVTRDAKLFSVLERDDLFDIAFTQGSESVLRDLETLKKLKAQQHAEPIRLKA